ncbi:MAG: hypothetical protein AAFO75_10185 [Pseudomonadota bacterium]
MAEHLTLKWGTLKGWRVESEAAKAALQAYSDAGPHSMSAMAQHDTKAQKEALCQLIDAIDGPIHNDWTGKEMSKEEAKKYVMEYS